MPSTDQKKFLTLDKEESIRESFLPTAASSQESEPKKELKLLLWPSLAAGTLMGTTNFTLGTISEIGMGATYLYPGGAIISAFLYQAYYAFKQKKATGEWWNVEKSNMYKEEGGQVSLKWGAVGCILLRTFLNLCLLTSFILAFEYASKAGLN